MVSKCGEFFSGYLSYRHYNHAKNINKNRYRLLFVAETQLSLQEHPIQSLQMVDYSLLPIPTHIMLLKITSENHYKTLTRSKY